MHNYISGRTEWLWEFKECLPTPFLRRNKCINKPGIEGRYRGSDTPMYRGNREDTCRYSLLKRIVLSYTILNYSRRLLNQFCRQRKNADLVIFKTEWSLSDLFQIGTKHAVSLIDVAKLLRNKSLRNTATSVFYYHNCGRCIAKCFCNSKLRIRKIGCI